MRTKGNYNIKKDYYDETKPSSGGAGGAGACRNQSDDIT